MRPWPRGWSSGKSRASLPPARSRRTNCSTRGGRTTWRRGFRDDQPCVAAAGALVIYLQETLKSSLAHIRRLRPYRADRHLALDEVTRRSLELTRTLRDGQREGSLLSVVDRTVTAMGARAL